MNLTKRIQALLDSSLQIPERDSAGIITPAGIDAKVRADTLKQCLKIINDEKNKYNKDK